MRDGEMMKAPGYFLPLRGGEEARQSERSPPSQSAPRLPLPLNPSPPTPYFQLLLGILLPLFSDTYAPTPKPALCKALPQDICAADSFFQLVTKLKTFHSPVIIFSCSFYFILLHVMNYVQYFWYSRKTLYQISTKENS